MAIVEAPVVRGTVGRNRASRTFRATAVVRDARRSVRSRVAAALVLAAAAATGACGEAEDEPLPARDLTIAGGNRGGVYFQYGRGIKRAVDAHLSRLRGRVLETSGSVENLRHLRDGAADVAFTRADSALDELGTDPSAGRVPIVALAKLYDSYVQVVVLADSRIARLADLRRRCDGRCRVAVGPAGSGTRLVAERLLTAAGLSGAGAIRRDRRLDIDEAMGALAGGRVDAVVWAGGLPTPAIEQLNERTDVRLVDLGSVAGQLRRERPDVYTRTRIPDSVYRSGHAADTAIPGSVGTVSVANYLAVRADLPQEIAFRLTALLFEHRRELVSHGHEEAQYLDRRTATDVYPLELHPGAVRYYREAAG